MKTLGSYAPIELIKLNIQAENEPTMISFMSEISKLYQYEIFKPLLDLVVTLCLNKRLTFKIYNRRFFELDEGNCRTIEGNTFNKMLNKIKIEKRYTITIKKTTSDVIIHELAHMLEQEGGFSTLQTFAINIEKDINSGCSNNISLKSAIQQIMIKEVESYPQEQKFSELFARFFQLIAICKEVAGFDTQYGYTLQEVYHYFNHTIGFLAGDFYNTIIAKIDLAVAQESKRYIKPIEEIKPKWADVKRNNTPHTGSGQSKWSKTIKSIKGDPFH